MQTSRACQMNDQHFSANYTRMKNKIALISSEIKHSHSLQEQYFFSLSSRTSFFTLNTYKMKANITLDLF